MTKLLEVKNLQTQFNTQAGTVQAVRGLIFTWMRANLSASLANLAPGKVSRCSLLWDFWQKMVL